MDQNWAKHEAKIVEVDKRGLDTQKRIAHLEEAFRKADIEGLTRKVVLTSNSPLELSMSLLCSGKCSTPAPCVCNCTLRDRFVPCGVVSGMGSRQ